MKNLIFIWVALIILGLISASSTPEKNDSAVLSEHIKQIKILAPTSNQEREVSSVDSKLVQKLSPTPTPISPYTQETSDSSTTPTSAVFQQSQSSGGNPALITPPVIANNNGWIKGRVMIGPSCGGPILVDSDNCGDKPYETLITVKDEKGEHIITSTNSDSNGEFKVELAPGTYIVIAGNSDKFPASQSQNVKVETNKTSDVSLSLDSGLR